MCVEMCAEMCASMFKVLKKLLEMGYQTGRMLCRLMRFDNKYCVFFNEFGNKCCSHSISF